MNNGLADALAAITTALEAVKDPETGLGLVSAGRIKGLAKDAKGRVSFALEAPAALAAAYVPVRDAAERAAASQFGVTGVTAVLTAHDAPRPAAASPAAPPPSPHAAPPAGATRLRKGEGAAPPASAPAQSRRPEGVPGVARIIAVSSAKGGVGKSTVAVNLACAFAALGLRTGLLDLDVYGPSTPTLLGLATAKPETGEDGNLIPLNAFGVRSMSIGYIVDVDAPMIWRGPMATSAVRQMLDDVAWAPLDILVLDLPPGTGDVHLTLAQRIPLDGAIIVSTPQEVALADVRRGLQMFARTHVPILGVVENMAWLDQPDGTRLALFGEGGARRTAEQAGVPFLGALPIDIALRQSGDAGHPLVASAPDHPASRVLFDIASAALAGLERGPETTVTIRFSDD
ncbi:MAG: ATP-binding protein [Alphaproteobacteria bacterium]|nr:ATP-binding protein [Alphaproteobacteria bacterium]